MAKRGLMYEFIVNSEILFADRDDWTPLVANRDGFDMALAKPFTGTKAVSLERTYADQCIQLGYSIFHVILNVDDAQPIPIWEIPFKLVKDFLQWIRVCGLQYWVGIMPTMAREVARGSVIVAEKQFTNFVGTTCPVTVHSLTKERWEWIGGQLAKNRVPNVPDLLMSDALISFSNGDFLQTIIRLGVICELELNAFIEDMIGCHSSVVQELYDERKSFETKLKHVAVVLGAEKYQDSNPIGYKRLNTLYTLRGKAIHHAKLEINGQPLDDEHHVSEFIMATLEFLQWTQDQRVKLNIPL